MSLPEHTERVVVGIERWSTRIMVFCAVGTCVCIAGMAFLVVQSISNANQGQQARLTQCAREPVLHEIVIAAAHYKLLKADAVQTFERTAPRGCPPP